MHRERFQGRWETYLQLRQAKRSSRGLWPAPNVRDLYKIMEFKQLTITHAMTSLVAVEASDRGTIKNLTLLLRAGLGNVAHLVAVVALWDATGNRLTTIRQALNVLLLGLGPTDILLGASRVRIEPKRNGELLVQVSLEVHVGVGRGKLTLQANEVQWDVHVAESLLELRVGGLRASLDILEEGLLDIVHVTILDSLAEALPGNLGLDDLNVATINLAWVGASSDGVAYIISGEYLTDERMFPPETNPRHHSSCISLAQQLGSQKHGGRQLHRHGRYPRTHEEPGG